MSSSVKATESFDSATEHGTYNLCSPSSEHETTEPLVATDEQRRDWQNELVKVEGEIATLRQVLGSKIRYATELKRKLGITPLQEMKHDFELGIKTIKDSSPYQKTSAVAKSAADKTSEVVSGISNKVTQKLGDLRNSQTFKSMECKVESAYASIKAKVSGSKSMEGTFEEALQREKENSSNGAAGAGGDAGGGGQETLPENKIPL